MDKDFAGLEAHDFVGWNTGVAASNIPLPKISIGCAYATLWVDVYVDLRLSKLYRGCATLNFDKDTQIIDCGKEHTDTLAFVQRPICRRILDHALSLKQPISDCSQRSSHGIELDRRRSFACVKPSFPLVYR